MNDDAFTRLPDQWSPDEAIERQLAQAAESPIPASLRQTTMQAMGRELRQTRAEGAWLLAAWVLLAALGWMQLSSVLAQTFASRPIAVCESMPADRPMASSLAQSWQTWGRLLLPLD